MPATVSRISIGDVVKSWKRTCCITICSAPCANANSRYGQKFDSPRASRTTLPESGSTKNANTAKATPAGAVQKKIARQSKWAMRKPPASGANALLRRSGSRNERSALARCCGAKLLWIRMRQAPIIGPMK